MTTEQHTCISCDRAPAKLYYAHDLILCPKCHDDIADLTDFMDEPFEAFREYLKGLGR